MMARARLLPVLAAIALLGACSDDPTPPAADDTIRGLVTDADGQPVAGAVIMLQLEAAPPPDKPQAAVRFTLPEAGPVSLWMASYCDGDTLRLLVDEELMAGEFTVIWNGRDDRGRLLPDGVYHAHLVTAAGASVVEVALSWGGYAEVAPGTECAGQATTDSRGRFDVAQDCLPFGFTLAGPLGPEAVTRRVRAWALHPDHAPAAAGWTTVDPGTGADVAVTFGD